MKLVSALVGLAALAGIALSTAAASAMPVTIPGQASQASNVEQADFACNEWGRCWHRPDYGDGYNHGGWGWHHRWYGGWHHGWYRGWHHGWRHWSLY
jgi:hypothetical protein